MYLVTKERNGVVISVTPCDTVEQLKSALPQQARGYTDNARKYLELNGNGRAFVYTVEDFKWYVSLRGLG